MRRALCLVFVLAGFTAPGGSETAYRLPPKEITQVIDTAPTPEVVVSPARDAMLLVEYEGYPPIAFVSQPMLRLAGLRIAPQTSSRQRLRRFTGLSIRRLDGTPARRVALPEGAKIGLPVWSHDGKRIAFTRDVADGVELWTADAATGKANVIAAVRVNDVLGRPFSWTRDNRRLLAWLVPAGRGAAPQSPRVPAGPVVQETAGKVSQMATFEDLLKDSHDEDLFQYYATAQLAVVDAASGAGRAIPPRHQAEETLLLPRPLLPLHADRRGSRPVGQERPDHRRPSDLRRGPAPGRRVGPAPRGLATAAAGDARLGRSARRRRPASEGPASREGHSARGAVLGVPRRGLPRQAQVQFAHLDGEGG
jgi:dipeptidyl aminopeptidase/acylaminoacyl peptidase